MTSEEEYKWSPRAKWPEDDDLLRMVGDVADKPPTIAEIEFFRLVTGRGSIVDALDVPDGGFEDYEALYVAVLRADGCPPDRIETLAQKMREELTDHE